MRSGNAHVMFPAVTTDEVILNRAEAYTMKKTIRKQQQIWTHGYMLSLNPRIL